MLSDSPHLRQILSGLLPGLNISSTPKASGQRVVYFCSFDPHPVKGTKPTKRGEWGKVVLKVSEGIDPTQIAYLQKEIEILNGFKSQHYPRLHWNDIYSEDVNGNPLPHRLFVTIEERIAAKPLSALMGKYHKDKDACVLTRAIVEALEPLWSHPQKLVHRDIKPDNLLIRESDGSVVIIDLGILREEGSIGITLSHQPFGPCSPPYASPEQANNDKKNITFKSDCFSLGIVAYELISGTHPFLPGAKTLSELFSRIKTKNPPPLHKVCGCDKRISGVVEKMMQKEPYRRHRTVSQLLSDLTI